MPTCDKKQMYARFDHVLTSEKNIKILCEAIIALGKSKHMVFTEAEANLAVEANLKQCIEQNVSGSRYLTNADALFTTNQYIIAKALNDLKEKTSNVPLAVTIAPENSTIQVIRRREVHVNDRAFQHQEGEGDSSFHSEARKMTPRELLG